MAEPSPGSTVAPSRSPDRTFVLLCAAAFLVACGLGVLYPLLARIQAIHHLPTYALGLMSGANFFAALVAQLGVGRLLDGRRARLVLLIGLLFGTVSLVWFAQASDLWQLVASRAVEGLGYGIVGPASLREAAVGATGDRRGSRLGILSSATMAGIVIGPLVGTLLAELGGVALPFEVIAALLGLVVVAFVLDPAPAAGATGATPIGEAVTGVPSTGAAVDGGPPIAATGGRRAAGRRAVPRNGLVAVLCLGAASQLPNGLYDALWSRLLTDRGASGLLIGVSLSLFGLPFVLLAPYGGRIAERRGPLLATAVALVVADGFMASYGFVPSPVIITVLGVAEACAQSVAVPGGYAAVSRVFPDALAATGQSWFSGAGTATAGLAAVLAAPAYGAFGSGAVFAGGAVVSAGIVLGGLAVGRPGTPVPVDTA